MKSSIVRWLWVMVLWAATHAATAAEVAGEVTAVSGEVYGQLSGEPQRRLAQGAKVYAGDEIRTAANSSVELLFGDQTRFVLGPQSQMSVTQYRYQPGDAGSLFDTRILQGVFRFFSGLIAKQRPQAVRISMPVATIGIRGTHVLGEVTATSAIVALLEPEEAGEPTAIEVSNQYGSVVLDQPNYETVIPDANSPPSPPRRVQTQRIDNLLRSIHTIRRINIPRPGYHR
ncbi:MAG: FecR family protein [Chromatiales bacterium]